MKTLAQFKKWLDSEPEPSDIEDSPEGGKHIPINKLHPLLDQLDPGWGTRNFKMSYKQLMEDIYADASIELTVSYAGLSRVITGAATFKIQDYAEGQDNNTHYAAIALANVTKSASKRLGRKFGAFINEKEDVYTGPIPKNKTRREAVKIQPDQTIRQQYAVAVSKGDKEIVEKMESIYQFQNF